MRIVFTKNTSPLSWLIRWVFSEPVSHTAFVFDNDKWLFQSNLLGVNVHWFAKWALGQTVVYSIDYPLSLEHEEAVFQGLLSQFAEDSYDFKAFFLFGWYGLLFKLFARPLPDKLTVQTNGFLCTEVAGKLPRDLTGLPAGVDLRCVTPFHLFTILRAAKGEA